MSEQHLFAAADYVTRMLMVNQISYTLIVGGGSLRLRGSSRGTHDVDIAVGCDMNRLLEVIRPQTRLDFHLYSWCHEGLVTVVFGA